MKTLNKTLISVIAAVGFAGLATAAQVTFQVNMSSQIGLGNFNPTTDSVTVAGDPINSWSPSASPLTNSASDAGLWVGAFDVTGTAGATAQYKYVITTPQATVWEGNVGTGGGTGNRTFRIWDTNQELPVVYFNNVTNSTTVSNAITFRVDLSVQTALGNFDPASGTVTMAGEFNGWSATATPLTNSTTETNIWFTTVVLVGADASSVSYKYLMNGTWEANNVGAGGSQNRSVSLARTNQTLPVVFFDNLASVPLPIPLAFQVDMTVQTALGTFNPATDFVEARGTFNNWNAGFTLTNSPAETNMFSGTWVDTVDAQGVAMQYQFVLNNASGANWETAVGNRSYTLTSTNEQTVPLVYFNNQNNLGSIAIQPGTGKQLVLSWKGAPLVRLQSAAGPFGAGWQEVPNTQGSNSATVPIGSGQTFYRLTGP